MLSSKLLVDSISFNSAMSAASNHDGISQPWRVAMSLFKDLVGISWELFWIFGTSINNCYGHGLLWIWIWNPSVMVGPHGASWPWCPSGGNGEANLSLFRPAEIFFDIWITPGWWWWWCFFALPGTLSSSHDLGPQHLVGGLPVLQVTLLRGDIWCRAEWWTNGNANARCVAPGPMAVARYDLATAETQHGSLDLVVL